MPTNRSYGRYEVTRLLGSGGSAEVYEAHDPLLDRAVAIKVIHPQLATDEGFEERFLREAQLVASLRHTHIVQLYDFGVVDGQPFMVMECLSGGRLKDRLDVARARGQALPPDEAVRILTPLADALDYAHSEGFIHRDIKPTNILFTADNVPVLTDFGIAKILKESAQVSLSGAVVGTPTYMSPEQAAGKPVNAASDIYSLGVVLYEMATGQVPFRGDSLSEVLAQHLNAPPPPPCGLNPQLPKAVEAVILRALAKDPTRRYTSAGELARAFAAAFRGEGIAPPVAVSADDPTLPDGIAVSPRSVAAAPAPVAGQTVMAGSRPAPIRALLAALRTNLSMGGRALSALRQSRFLFSAAILASLGFVLAAGIAIGLDQALPTAAGGFLPALVVLSFASSTVAVLLWVTRARGRGQRRQAVVIGALCGMATLASGGWLVLERQTGPPVLTIAVADFDGSNASRRVDFARRIVEQLTSELSDGDQRIRVVRTREIYPDAATARARGARRQAALVIWGWYDDAGVSSHVEVLQVPSLRREVVTAPFLAGTASASGLALPVPSPAPSLRELTRFVRTPAAMPDLEVFVQNGPQQMTFISAAVLGLAAYANGDIERALALFDRALANVTPATGENPVPGLEVVYFQRATVMYQQNKLPEAVTDLEQAVSIKPSLYEAHRNLAIAYSETCSPAWQIDRAVAEAETASRLKPEDVAAYRLLGDLYRQSGRYEEAVKQFQAALRIDVNDADTQALLADALAASGQADAATAARQSVLRLRQQAATKGASAATPQEHLRLGDAYLALEEYDRALAAYQAALRLAPSDPEVFRALGNAYFGGKQYDLAASQYTQVVKLMPQDEAAHLLLGLVFAAQKKGEEAIAEFRQATALSACSTSPHLLLAGLYWQDGKYDEAATEYAAALVSEPQNPDILYLLGSTQYLRGALDEAAKALQAAVALQPNTAAARYALGIVLADRGSYAEAAAQFEATAELMPDSPATYVSLGDTYEKSQRWADAAAAYQKALALEDDANTRVFLGLVYARQGMVEAAIAEYRQALALAPQNALAFSALGDAYAQQGAWDEAILAYQSALAQGENAGLHAQIALVYTRQGKLEDAVAEYRAAVSLDGQSYPASYALAGLYAQLWRLDEAAAQYQAALQLKPSSAEALLGLAAVEYKQCHIGAAVQAAGDAVAASSHLSYYRGVLAAFQEAQGASDDATQTYAELMAAPVADIFVHLLTGDYTLRTGAFTETVRQYELVLRAPNLPPLFASLAHNGLGQAYLVQNQVLTAQQEFASALKAFPAHAEAQMWLGDISLMGSDAANALALYDRALLALPDYGQQVSADNADLLAIGLQIRRSLALRRQGHSDEANQALNQALAQAQAILDLGPQWPLAHFALALVYTARGEQTKADAEFVQATQCDQSLVAARVRAAADLARLR